MDSIYILIPIALLFTTVAIASLFWAIDNGQYDNLDTESERILFDDVVSREPNKQAEPKDSSDSLSFVGKKNA